MALKIILGKGGGNEMYTIPEEVVEWDIKNWSSAIRFWEKDMPENLEGKKVLDIGGRNGGLSLFWALKGADVVCSDISSDGYKRAKKLHKKYGVSEKISYEIINVLEMSYQEEFDIVTFKSVLGGGVGSKGHNDRQKLMIENIYNALKPEGTLYFAENLIASSFHQWARKKFTKWGDSWRYISIGEAKKLTGNFASFSYWCGGVFGCFGRNKALALFFGNIDCIFDRFFRPETKYIISGICKKR